jgi:methionyl-tRNA synthetase
VLYVWIDALLNYATAVGYGDPTAADKFARTWPPDVHLVGKDILRFHAVIWPAMLMAAEVPLPRTVFAHGWLLVGGEKMSKSKLTAIPPSEITDVFGSDAFRYYFLRAIPFGHDGSFSWEDMAARYKAELADQLGNLASRLTAMVGRYRDGSLPAPVDEPALEEAALHAVTTAEAAIDKLDLQGAILAAMELVRVVNNYVTESAPWQVAKDEARAADLDRILYATAEALRVVAVLLNPVMPRACGKLWAALGAESALGPVADQRVQDAATWGRLPEGATVTKTEPLFPRVEEKAEA